MKNVKIIKAITELALEDMWYIRNSSSFTEYSYGELAGYCKVLAYLRGTTDDHEWNRIARLYKMRKKRDEF